MCWGLFLIKLQAFNLATLLKRNSNTGGSCGIAKFLRTSFFASASASESPTTVEESQRGCLFFDFTPPRPFDFDQKFTQNVAQIVFYYQVTK